MKNIRQLSYAAAVILITSTTACNKQLAEDNPHDLIPETQYTNPSGFTTLVNMAYQDLHQVYGIEDGMFLCESGTDLWFNDTRSGYAAQITQYLGLASGQSQPKNHWVACYRGINYCNTGINGIDKAGYTNATDKNARLSELKFLRALYYYHLVEQFGAVPLQLTSSLDGINLQPERAKPEDIYAVMIDDLNFAKDNLPVTQPISEYSRASKKAALGLLARVLLTRAYYATGAEATSYFTQAKTIAEQVINDQATLGVGLYPQGQYAKIGNALYGAPATRATHKEAMFVLAYNPDNTAANAYANGNPGGNRIFKWMMPKYTGRPGMSTAYVYGADNEQRLMPTWHLLDLFDETVDARYNADFQEVWIANQAWTWIATGTKANLTDVNKLKYTKSASVDGLKINVGDTAMYFTKKVWGGTLTRTYLEMDRNELYVNPVHGQGANLSSDKIVATSSYPAFKKFLNPSPSSTTATTDWGDAMIIRLAEMYLIAAEASVQLGDQTTAAKWVNVIRARAAIPGQEAAMVVTPAQMDINFILDERAREFAGEEQRWYDLKRVFRTGEDWTAYITKYNPDLTSILPYHRLRPIPLTELQAVNDAKAYGQNPGYDQP
jgi:starch-binding outer membrane protein, SusD/RagB family